MVWKRLRASVHVEDFLLRKIVVKVAIKNSRRPWCRQATFQGIFMFICSAQIWLKIYTFGWLNLSIAINCLAFRFKHFNFVPKHHSIDSVIISNLLPYRSWHLLRPQKAAVNLNHFSFEDYQSGWTQCLICMVFFPKLLMFGSTRETISTARKSYLKYEDPAKMDFKTS